MMATYYGFVPVWSVPAEVPVWSVPAEERNADRGRVRATSREVGVNPAVMQSLWG